MKIINESHLLFHQRIIACLEEYAPEPIKSLKMDLFAKKERTNTRELAWLLAVLKRKCPYDNIPWKDQNLQEYVNAIDTVFHKKINDEIQMCHNLFEINSLPMVSRTDAIYKKLGISWEITHNYKGEGIGTYWIEPLEDLWLSISFRLIESVNADLIYKQKLDLQKEPEVTPDDKDTQPANGTHALSKPSLTCSYKTKNLYLASEQVLLENPQHDLNAQAIYSTLLTKEGDPNYKIKSVDPYNARSQSITFQCRTTFNPHSARQHINKVIEWFQS